MLMLLVLAMGCELVGDRGGGPEGAALEEIPFSRHVLPLLREKFAPLLVDETGLRLDSWETLIAGSDFGEVLIPFDSENSLLIELATKLDPPHPANRLTPEEIAFVARWVDAGARSDAGRVPYEGDGVPRLYACNQDDGTVSVIHSQANVVIRTVDFVALGYGANPKPHHVAVEPDGSFWYVSLIGANRVVKLDRRNRVVGEVAMETPGMLVVHPARDLLVAGRSMTAVNPPASVGLIRRSDLTLEEVGTFFPRPHALAVVDGYAYTASLAENQLVSVDLDSRRVRFRAIDGPSMAFVHYAAAPDGQTLVLTSQLTGEARFLDLTEDPAQPTVIATLLVRAQPWHPVYGVDGRRVYFGNKAANSVTVLDVANRTVAAVIEGRGLAQPHGSAVSPRGGFLYVSSTNADGTYTPRYDFGDNTTDGTVTVIDTETNQIVKVLEVGHNATGLGVQPRCPCSLQEDG